MRIVMVTNTYLPHVGGVANSVDQFARGMREAGHEVLIVCPTFADTETNDNVLRVPALEHFRDSDFSFPLPIPIGVHRTVTQLAPDVVHSHHPFLLGDTALRIGAELGIPVVFTHHTQYEKYTHYFAPDNSALVKSFINELDVGYCNLCDAVVAPSQTVADELRFREVESHVTVIPTGVDVDWWATGDGHDFRRDHGLPGDAFIVGHVGRLAHEKNLPFLAGAVAQYLTQNPGAWFIVSGIGPCQQELISACADRGVAGRLLVLGLLKPESLRALYHAIDVFAFASQSETQGIVLAEAMACGKPVVAIDAPGVREIVVDRINGRMLAQENFADFANALDWIAKLDAASRRVIQAGVRRSAQRYSMDRSIDQLLDLYQWVSDQHQEAGQQAWHDWRRRVHRLECEWRIWSNFAHALGDAVGQIGANKFLDRQPRSTKHEHQHHGSNA